MSLVDDFVAMSHAAGAPELDAVILGEGNTSVLATDDTAGKPGLGHSAHGIKGHEGRERHTILTGLQAA